MSPWGGRLRRGEKRAVFDFKPDFEQVLERYEAWWNGAVLDRALTSISFAKPLHERIALPEKTFAAQRARWWDAQYQAELAHARLANMVYGADAVPTAYANLGPDVFAAFYGCELVFAETTSWSEPFLSSWQAEALEALRLDLQSSYFKKIDELTDVLLDVGRGKFNVGYTDLHPGADALAALRGPENLCIDLIERPAEVAALCRRVTQGFLQVYDIYHERLSSAGNYSATWLGAISRGKMHVPCNDFSCMISERHFVDLFLPEIVRECRHMDRNVYHLDGPQALRFLDLLLEVPEIDAVQWVPGAGQDDWKEWIEVFQQIQAADKAFIVYRVLPDELDLLFEKLRPEGVWLHMAGIQTREAADAALKRISAWR